MTEEPPVVDELSAIFARMSGLLISEQTVQTALGLVVSLAQETIRGTVGAGVTLIRDERKVTAAASDPVVGRADGLQYEMDEGPCLTAYRERRAVRVDDTATEQQWPRWTAAAHGMGLRSSLSVPLLASEQTLGAIKVYSDQPRNFDERAETVLAMFGAQAGTLVANVLSYEDAQRLSAQLREALITRDIIGQAKGIVMAREGLDEPAAFALLAKMSQDSHRKLRDVAQQLTESVVRPPT